MLGSDGSQPLVKEVVPTVDICIYLGCLLPATPLYAWVVMRDHDRHPIGDT